MTVQDLTQSEQVAIEHAVICEQHPRVNALLVELQELAMARDDTALVQG